MRLPGSEYQLPIDYWSFRDGNTLLNTHPVMLYQDCVIERLEKLDLTSKLNLLKSLLQLNRWYYKPVENFAMIENYLIDNSFEGFPSSFYSGAWVKKNGEAVRWNQMMFTDTIDFDLYLGLIEDVLNVLITLAKRDNTKKIEIKKKKALTVESIFGDASNDFRNAVREIIKLQSGLVPAQRIKHIVSFLIKKNLITSFNATALSDMFFLEFGTELELKKEVIRKALNKNEIDELEANTKIIAPLTKKFP